MSTTETTVLNPDSEVQSPVQNNNFSIPATDASVESGSTTSVRSRPSKRLVQMTFSEKKAQKSKFKMLTCGSLRMALGLESYRKIQPLNFAYIRLLNKPYENVNQR